MSTLPYNEFAPLAQNETRASLSACIITRDEAERLPACLESVEFCDEIVLVDGGSTDATVQLAEAAGARVVRQPWLGFAAQRNIGLDHAHGDWVLEIDADERVSPALRGEIDHRGAPKIAYHQLKRALAAVAVWTVDGREPPVGALERATRLRRDYPGPPLRTVRRRFLNRAAWHACRHASTRRGRELTGRRRGGRGEHERSCQVHA